MPLTFAHPAVVLPFSRKSKYINFSALVLGSMAPDFEYFLRGQPLGEIGHTWMGFFLFNLPLVAAIYFIYHIFMHQTIVSHLPAFLQEPIIHKVDSSRKLKVIVFCYSALFGMLTHVVWDSFTHMHGYMVIHFPILAQTFDIYGHNIPLYKFLQHGSTLVGIIAIIGYMYFRALLLGRKKGNVNAKQKLLFWSSVFLLTIFTAFLWNFVDYVSIISYGILVVRIIDSFLVSLLIISVKT
ncbi:DUF4184 family protein [Cytobacillus sp. FJAT-53684]|uniref:DUF4184 family protein n=1 Tax=Cytobacillus mangrovibacter TaxID=3299024 RepID=A0ABW6K152_9BACI